MSLSSAVFDVVFDDIFRGRGVNEEILRIFNSTYVDFVSGISRFPRNGHPVSGKTSGQRSLPRPRDRYDPKKPVLMDDTKPKSTSASGLWTVSTGLKQLR